MTKLTYQATSLRSLVKQMLPSAESKNISESKYMMLTVRERELDLEDGSRQKQYVLVAGTDQPTFDMEISLPLSTDQVETDGLMLRVNTRDLDEALGSFGQRMVTMSMSLQDEFYVLCISDGDPEDSNGKMLVLAAELEEDYTPMPTYETLCTLADVAQLVDGMKAAAAVASKRGNGPRTQRVAVSLTAEELSIQAENPGAIAHSTYVSPWLQTPASDITCGISPDAARHLVAALIGYAHNEPVHLTATPKALMVETRDVKMMADR